jgi:hypothetical protein
MISRRIILELAPHLKLGEEKKFNHPGCKAGEDIKHRLYIKRVVGGRLAYCHHCNEHGFARDLDGDGTRLREWLFGKTEEYYKVTMLDKPLPHTTITNPHLINWLWEFGLAVDSPSVYNRFFQVNTSSLGLLITNPAGTTIGCQIRSFDPKKPKYTTHYYRNSAPFYDGTCWFLQDTKSEKLFITEDILSAFRIYRDTLYSAVALLKTTMSTKTLEILQKLYGLETICLWLDPDEAGKKGSSRIANRLEYILPKEMHIDQIEADEPKHQSVINLQRICDGL